MIRPLALTPGDPAGIGPDLVLQLAARGFDQPTLVIADPALLSARARLLGLNVSIHAVDEPTRSAPSPGECHVLPVTLAEAAVPGQPNPANAAYVLESLRLAAHGCQSHRFAAMVTAPVNKAVINSAGTPFSGHTEFLAELTGGTPVMMLACPGLRVALTTTHIPLHAVPGAITVTRLHAVLRVLHEDLIRRFHIPQPRILVCGLNPHAGEEGHLGTEERDTIQPALEHLRAQGLQLIGPLPADTLFTPHHLDHADAVLAMYHDQGLPVLKHKGFGEAVNITLGLPIVRTSVDHGTAYDLAGSGQASSGSLRAAIDMAAQLSH